MNQNRTPEESSAVEPRIRTRCPSCGNETLFVPEHGLLTCSWIQCREPAAINESAKRESNAYREGFEACREMAAKVAEKSYCVSSPLGPMFGSGSQWGCENAAKAIRALPTPTTKG